MEVTNAYMFKGFISSKVILLHCGKALQKQVEGISGVEVYDHSKGIVRFTIPSRASTMSQLDAVLTEHSCIVRELR